MATVGLYDALILWSGQNYMAAPEHKYTSRTVIQKQQKNKKQLPTDLSSVQIILSL